LPEAADGVCPHSEGAQAERADLDRVAADEATAPIARWGS